MPKYHEISMIMTMTFIAVAMLMFIYGVASHDYLLMIDAAQLMMLGAAIGLPITLVTRLINY